MANYTWIITEDHISDSKAGVNVMGPRDMHLGTPDQVKGHPGAQPFKLYDDDGVLYYEGLYVGPDDDSLFGPLDDFGLPNAGCTSVHYRNRHTGEFQAL